jgi:hypothetical protein
MQLIKILQSCDGFLGSSMALNGMAIGFGTLLNPKINVQIANKAKE